MNVDDMQEEVKRRELEAMTTTEGVTIVVRPGSEGRIEMDVDFGDNFDHENPLPYQMAAMIMLNAVHEAGEDFERVEAN